MHRNYLLALFTTAVVLFAVAPFDCTAAPKKEKRHTWVKDFEENFNRKHLNENVWAYVKRAKTSALCYMSSNPECYEFTDSTIILKAIVNDCDPLDTARYLTGGIYTRNLYEFTPGRFEIRARIKTIQGGQPAIWTGPFNHVPWPTGGEIDIMEQYNHGKHIYQTVWSPYSYTLKIHDPKHQVKVPLDPEEFHIYGVDIMEDRLVFHVDGVETLVYPKIETDKEGQFPFYRSVYLFLDTQIIGKWGGPVNEDDLPEILEVDYVKHYRYK